MDDTLKTETEIKLFNENTLLGEEIKILQERIKLLTEVLVQESY